MKIVKYALVGTGLTVWIAGTAVFALYLHHRHGVLRKPYAGLCSFD